MTSTATSDIRADKDRLARRNTLLGIGAAVLLGGFVFGAIAGLLQLIDFLQRHVITGFSLAQGLSLGSAVIGGTAVAVAVVGFVGSPLSRSRRLGTAAILYAAALVTSIASLITSGGVAAAHGYQSTYVASEFVAACAGGLLMAAAVVAASGFLSATGAVAGPNRDRRLGWAGISLAGSSTLAATASILFSVALSDQGATAGFTAGGYVTAGGDAIAIAGGIIAAVALLNSARRQHVGAPGWLSQRDGLLGGAAAVLAIGFLVTSLGGMIAAGASSANGYDGKETAVFWLDSIERFALMAAAALASAGFLLSRRGPLS